MLLARSKEGKMIDLRNTPTYVLTGIRSQDQFFCPECKMEVILKAGRKRITHFAHKKSGDCLESYERESQNHMNGKLLIYDWLKTQGFRPQLENLYPEIRQRADIGFSLNGLKYALEYQCSIIPEKLFIQRTENYLQSGIRPLWILSVDHLNRRGNNQFILSDFHYLFLQQNATGNWVLPFFCTSSKSFITLDFLLPITAKNSLGQLSIKKLSFHTLSEAMKSPQLQIHHKEWEQAVRRLKNQGNIGHGLFPQHFLKELYLAAMYPAHLPPEIGLPVKHGLYISTSSVQWQSYLYLDILRHQQPFTLDEAFYSFKKRINRKHIKLRTINPSADGHAFIAVKEYMVILQKLSILSSDDGYHYLVNKPILLNEKLDCIEKSTKSFYLQFGKRILHHTLLGKK
ncbi:competence protein CoiA [Cytobacillus purgationiresistens]|uniref:Competence CoiA-like predicted nuclease n=1 Tax=Cytobacillus purgationiresistens TaxID=863449 RepID=A0ABU0ACF6_9BACI|nr:competence protein CoiA family protein [Cytobacillus purgationiresistens]MDQ0268725.1 competence CoiA-like predicted nuclease [Cytobacillus purgationiresistens]